MDNGYEQEPIGRDRVRFTVRPLRLSSSPVGGLLAGGITGALALAGTSRWVTLPARVAVALLLMTVVARGVAAFGRARDARRERLRVPGGTFVASPAAIETGERRITGEALARLAVRNPLLGRRGEAGKIVRASYALYADATILAGGMTEGIALGLLADVSRVVGSASITRRGARAAP
jgi:hypothetical protein